MNEGDCWETPDIVLERVRILFGGQIDLDPATSETANARIGATNIYTIEDDGLNHNWFGTTWLNLCGYCGNITSCKNIPNRAPAAKGNYLEHLKISLNVPTGREDFLPAVKNAYTKLTGRADRENLKGPCPQCGAVLSAGTSTPITLSTSPQNLKCFSGSILGAETVSGAGLRLNRHQDGQTPSNELGYSQRSVDIMSPLKEGNASAGSPPSTIYDGNTEPGDLSGTGVAPNGTTVGSTGTISAPTVVQGEDSPRTTLYPSVVHGAQEPYPQTSYQPAKHVTLPRGHETHISGARSPELSRVYSNTSPILLEVRHPSRVWANPPYSKVNGQSQAGAFLTHLLEQHHRGYVTEALFLTNVCTGSRWFIDMWRLDLCFLYERIRFVHPSLRSTSPRYDNVIGYLGLNTRAFVRVFSGMGHFMEATP